MELVVTEMTEDTVDELREVIAVKEADLTEDTVEELREVIAAEEPLLIQRRQRIRAKYSYQD